jgi:peroxiredoxin
MWLRKITFTFTLLLALAAVTRAAELKTGDSFPDLQRFGLVGEIPRELKGKVVLVDFWASWCAPCKQSFPALNDLLSKYGSRGLVIVGISVDESKAAMDQFIAGTPAKFPILHDAKQKLVQDVNVEAMPTSFIVDSEGKVRFIHNGFHGQKTRDQYAREIEGLLPKTTAKSL